MFPRNPHLTELPWPAIREEYETTEISVTKLAEKWGIASKTTVIRRRDAEQWTKRTVPSHLALVRVAELREPPAEPPPAPAEPAASADPVAEPVAAAEPEMVDILTARALARMQSGRIHAQLRLAEEVQQAGMAIIRRLQQLLDTDDEAAARTHIQRLIAVSPDRETLAGLVRAASEAIDKGVVIERRALGMDVRTAAPPDAVADQVTTDEGAVQIVRQLDVSLGLQLRQFAERALATRRDARIGVTA